MVAHFQKISLRRFFVRKHWFYLKYIIKHKWYVFLACRKFKCSLWRAVIHDISKFYPDEWFGYINTFFNENGTFKKFRDETGAYDPTEISKEFDYYWLSHQRRNKHHWQYWILVNSKGEVRPLEIPDTFIKEMVADWIGAGKAQNNNVGPMEWYERNKYKMILHKETRRKVEELIKGENYGNKKRSSGYY